MLIQALLLNEAIHIRLSFMSGFPMVYNMYGCWVLEIAGKLYVVQNAKKGTSVHVRVYFDGKEKRRGGNFNKARKFHYANIWQRSTLRVGEF